MHSVEAEEALEIVSGRLLVRLVVVLVALASVTAAFLVVATPVVSAATPRAVVLPATLPDYMKYIQVNSYKFDPLGKMPSIPDSLSYGVTPPGQTGYFIVQFNGPVTDAMKASLERTGVVLLYYINYNAFIVRGDGFAIQRASILPIVRWTGVFQPAYKLSPTLSDSYAAMAEKQMEKELTGQTLDSGVVTSFDTASTAPAKSVSVDANGQPTSASFSNKAAAAGMSSSASAGAGQAAGGALGEPASSVADLTPRAVATYSTTTVWINVLTFEKSWVPAATQAIYMMGGTNIRYNFNLAPWGTIQASVNKNVLPSLARLPGIMWIDRETQPYIFNDIARWVVQSGNATTFATPVHDHGIWGTNQTITLGDTGIDYQHPDFWDPNNTTPGPTARKLTAYYEGCGTGGGCDLTDNGINHGTHTSGSAAGDDGKWHVYDGDPTGSNGTTGPHDGQAFDAFLNMQDLSNDGYYVYFTNIDDLWNLAVNHSSWVHSDSWGSCCSTYGADQASTDAFVWSNVNFTIFFAAGNSGSSLGTMNPYGGAKNVIAVGATLNGPSEGSVASFSSRGPMADGRLKPDIMAPGVNLWSAKGLCPSPCGGTQYWQLSGTSMATPTSAGSGILVRQYYMDGWYPTGTANGPDGFTPTAALIKATLINSAVEMTGSGAYDNGQSYYPNDNQGWGRILLDNALFFQSDTRGLVVDDHRAGIGTGDFVNYTLNVGDTGIPVEITLVWSDYPDNPLTTPNLVNDLNLMVTAPDGTTYLGNVYAGMNPGQSVPNPSPGSADHLNNVENVLVISNVQAGAWKISVSGYNVPQGPQPFALVMTGGIATNRGQLSLDHHHYKSSATVGITVVDTGLNTNPNAPDTGTVNVSSSPTGDFEIATVTETGNDTSVFMGTMQLALGAASPNDSVLQVANGDTITVDYFDANNGQGVSDHVIATALVDDTPPVISGINVTNLRFNRATILWTTDEPSTSVVDWGNTTPPGSTSSDSALVTSHSISLKNLNDNTTYYFDVSSTDEAGNTATDNNGGLYYNFTTPVRPPTAVPDPEWPTYHNNLVRQGISPSKFTPPMNQMWTDGPYTEQLWNGPVMKDGILFTDPLDGTLRARDPYTGATMWKRHLGDQYYYTGTMAVDNGVLFATFYGSRGGFVYALDENTGNTIWVDDSSTGLDFNARIAMAVSDGLVFGSAWGGQMYALNETTGAVVWTFQTGDLPFGGLTVANGMVYQPTIGGSMFAVDEFSGALVWQATLDNTATSVPLFAQGYIYEGTYSGTMYALDSTTGAVVWQTTGFNLIDFSTPAYDGAAVYFGDFNNEYVALDASSGSLLWSTTIGGPVGSALAYANGFLYGAAWDGQFRVIDSSDGTIVETHSLNSYASTSTPAISDGWVWFEDLSGNAYGYFGQLPVGVIVSPGSQSQDATPSSTVAYNINATNVGISGTDTFDVTVALGTHGWTVGLFEADGTTPLPDTNGNGIPDTGPLATGASTTIVVKVTVPGAPPVNPGDTELDHVTFTSTNDVTVHKTVKVTTVVPPPGVTVGPRQYFTPQPGDTVAATMQVSNTGGFPDTIDVTAVSGSGWNATLFEADGTTPLPDTNGDGIPDTGVLQGLTSTSVVVKVQVPADATLGTFDKTAVTGTSTLSPGTSATGYVVIELVLPPDEQWPTFHNDNPRHGQSPADMGPPLTQHWTAGPYTLELWTGPVMADGILFSTTLDGYIRARDPFSGDILWQQQLGGQYYYTGTPTVANGVVYAMFDTGSVSGLYALNETTGAVIWADTGGSPFYNARIALAYDNGRVFGSTWAGDIFAVSAADGSLLWDYSTGGDLPFGGLTVNGGTVYMPAVSGNLYAIDETTGLLVWMDALDGTATSVPLYAQGMIFEGTYAGTMWALDAGTGATIWSTGGFSLIDFSTPAYDGNNIYFGDFGNEYNALDVGTGAIVWQTPITGPVGSSVAEANGYIYGAAWDGYLRVMNASNGNIVDQHLLSAYASTSSPAISRGWVWVEDLNGEIYGFGAPGAGELRGVQVLPGIADIQVGKAALFRATGVDAFGNRIPVKDADWLPLDGLGSVLKVSGDTALYIAGIIAGNDTLQATSEGIAGNATVHVLPGPLDRIEVYMLDPQGNRIDGPVSIEAGAQRTFGAAATDRFGNPITGATFTWAEAGGIGTIDSAGVFHASTTVGTGYVTATYGGRTGQQLVTIVPGAPAAVDIDLTSTSLEVDSSTLIVGTVRDAYGNANPGGVLRWATTGSGSVLPLTPDGRSILYHAPTTTTPASVQLTATIGTVTHTITLTIVAGPTELIQVAMLVGGSPSGDPVSIPAGSQQTFVADATDRFGNPIEGATFVWGVTGGIGTIDSTGRFTASTTPGTGFVSATQGGRTGRQTVTIVPAAPATLAIELPSTSLMVDSQSLVVASVLDVYGNSNLDGVVRWTTTGTGTVLSLTPDGRSILYHAPITTTPASAQLTATIGTVTQTITLTIVAGPPVGISIDAPATTVAVGGTLAFGSVVTDQFGNAVTGATIAWKTTAGSINQQGVFTAPSQPGLVVITASTAGRESFVVIDVTSGGFEQFSREATSATSLALLVATVIAIAACVFLFVRYRGTRRELDEMRKGGQGGGGGGVA